MIMEKLKEGASLGASLQFMIAGAPSQSQSQSCPYDSGSNLKKQFRAARTVFWMVASPGK